MEDVEKAEFDRLRKQKIMENIENLEKLAVKAGYKNYKEFKNELDKNKILAFGINHHRPDVYEFVSWMMKKNRVAVRFSSLRNNGYFFFKVDDRLGIGIDYFLMVGMLGDRVGHTWFMKKDFEWVENRKSISISIKSLKRFEQYEIDNIEKIRKVCEKYGIEYYLAENGIMNHIRLTTENMILSKIC